MKYKDDLTGKTIYYWKVLRQTYKPGTKKKVWECECIGCNRGNKSLITSSILLQGKSKSCGCRVFENRNNKNKYDFSNEYCVGYDSKGRKFLFDKSDYELVSQYNWIVERKGYVSACCPVYKDHTTKKVLLHRIIIDPPEDMFVDHINHDPSDNRRSNLRVVTNQQNQWNSKCKGYCYHKGKKLWMVYIHKDGKTHYKYCHTEEEAKNLRSKFEGEYFKEYAYYTNTDNIV